MRKCVTQRGLLGKEAMGMLGRLDRQAGDLYENGFISKHGRQRVSAVQVEKARSLLCLRLFTVKCGGGNGSYQRNAGIVVGRRRADAGSRA